MPESRLLNFSILAGYACEVNTAISTKCKQLLESTK